MADRNRDGYEGDRTDRRTRRLRGGAFGGDYARDDWPYGLGGDYAWDDWRHGFSGDYARDERWSGPGQTRGMSGGDYGLGAADAIYGGTTGPADVIMPAGDRPNYRGVGPKNYQRSDERIAEDVNDVLTEDAWLDASGIEVDVKNGKVTLAGTVSNRAAKRLAEDLASRCLGVRDVHNRLRVEDTEDDVHIGKASE